MDQAVRAEAGAPIKQYQKARGRLLPNTDLRLSPAKNSKLAEVFGHRSPIGILSRFKHVP
jgi:hypothetical protein